MQVQVKKWGNSASVRIPSALMTSAHLQLDQMVEIREEGGRLVIEPIVVPSYDLDDMLSNMTPDTFHDDVDFGATIGGEVW
jgi:antitoxin MazE